MDALARDPPRPAGDGGVARPQLDLELRGIRKRYGSFVAVDGVSLKVGKGQFVCLLGPSGCGKTTTLRCIAGLEEPDDGDILIGGKEATRDPPWQRDIAMMFQDFALFPHMTVARQVGFGLEMLKKPRAMITEPRILLLDEPIGALDYSLRETVMLELKLLQKRTGISFIWVTHDQNEAFSLGDLVVVMNHARIEQQGSPEDILQRPATAFVAGFVQGNNVFHGRIVDSSAGVLRIETDAGTFLVPALGTPPAVGAMASFSVRAERLTDAPAERHPNRLSAHCTTVEYFGAVRRHIFQRLDGELLKYDQFGALAPRIAVGETVTLGWQVEDAVLHVGGGAAE